MKTDTTRAIEQALRYYRPSEVCGMAINKFRATHTAFEVPVTCGTTTDGIVDCLRIQEYFSDIRYRHFCTLNRYRRNSHPWADEINKTFKCPKGYGPDEKPFDCEDEGGAPCIQRRVEKTGTQDILISAFEIKVTKSDFKSKHGHNFVGNCNYYVIPRELYEDVKDLVPEDIGIILYHSAGTYTGLRRKKECTFKPLEDADQKWLILSALKRIRAQDYEDYTRKTLGASPREIDLF